MKSNGQEWVVKNAYGVLYMGSKDMCKVFMQNTTLAKHGYPRCKAAIVK